jgi:hypothetical protein
MALLGSREMPDLGPQSGPKRTLIKRAAVSCATSVVTCQAITCATVTSKACHRLRELSSLT